MPRSAVVTGQISHYPKRVRQTAALISSLADAAQETAVALEASAADVFVYTILDPITVTGFRCLVTVTLDYDTQTAEAVIALDHRITFASDTGRVALGTVALADGTAAGIQLYTTFTPVNLERGDQLVVEVATAGTGGMSIAGDWLPVIITESTDFEDITLLAADAGLTLTA